MVLTSAPLSKGWNTSGNRPTHKKTFTFPSFARKNVTLKLVLHIWTNLHIIILTYMVVVVSQKPKECVWQAYNKNCSDLGNKVKELSKLSGKNNSARVWTHSKNCKVLPRKISSKKNFFFINWDFSKLKFCHNLIIQGFSQFGFLSLITI